MGISHRAERLKLALACVLACACSQPSGHADDGDGTTGGEVTGGSSSTRSDTTNDVTASMGSVTTESSGFDASTTEGGPIDEVTVFLPRTSILSDELAVVVNEEDPLSVAIAEYFERSIAAYQATDAFDPLDLSRPIGNPGRTEAALGDHPSGISSLLEAITMIENAVGPTHPELSPHCLNLGSIYLKVGEHEAALAQMQRALEIDRKHFGAGHPFVASTLASMGEVHLSLDHNDEAIALLEEALVIQEGPDVDAINLAATQFALARALWPNRRQRPRAQELLARAEEALEGSGAAGLARLGDLRSWRASH